MRSRLAERGAEEQVKFVKALKFWILNYSLIFASNSPSDSQKQQLQQAKVDSNEVDLLKFCAQVQFLRICTLLEQFIWALTASTIFEG